MKIPGIQFGKGKGKDNKINIPTSDSYSSFTQSLSRNVSYSYTGDYSSITNNQAILDRLYRKVWLCYKVVDVFAEDMTRGGIKITGLPPNETVLLQKSITSLGIWSALSDLIKWARLYGGSIGYIDIEGQDPSTQLNLLSIAPGQFKGIKVFDRFRADPVLIDDCDIPEYYRIETIPSEVHCSRVVRFIGVKLPYRLAKSNNFWGDSVLERIKDCISLRENALKNSADMINRAILRTVKIEGLRQILAAGGEVERNLIKMFDRMKEVQDTAGITLLDNTDTFQTDTFTFTGLQELLTSFDQELAGASDIPMTRLYGQSPNGFSTGDSDLQTYYDKISSQQESVLREPLTKILNICYSNLTGKVLNLDEIDFEFVSVWQPNEIADRQQIVNEINLILSAEEKGLISSKIALSELRERGKKYGLFSSITDSDIDNLSVLSNPAPDPNLTEADIGNFELSPDIQEPIEDAGIEGDIGGPSQD